MNTESHKLVATAKALIVAIWLVCIANWIVGFPAPWHTILRYLLYAVIVVHLLETLYFLPRILKSAESLPVALFKSFIFGMFHNYRYLRRKDQLT